MLKNLLKYEFRATGRTYGGLYLVWLLVALAMGISMRDEVWDNGSSQICLPTLPSGLPSEWSVL